MKIKKTLILATLFLILSTSLYARDSNGQLFHYRLSFRADVLNYYNHHAPTPLPFGSKDFMTYSLTHDALFYKSDSLRHGPRLDMNLNYSYDEDWSFNLGIGYHVEVSFWYMTIGFKTFVMGDFSSFYNSLSFSSTEYDARYFSGLWAETGFIINFNRKPKGLVLEIGVSAVPASVNYRKIFSGSSLDVFGPVFLENFDIVVGLGYTF